MNEWMNFRRVCWAQMWPICGDGLTLQILHTRAGSATPEILMSRRHPPGSHEKPQRQKVRLLALNGSRTHQVCGSCTQNDM